MSHYLQKFLSANGVKDRMLRIFFFFTWTSATILTEKIEKSDMIMIHPCTCKHGISTRHKEMDVSSAERNKMYTRPEKI